MTELDWIDFLAGHEFQVGIILHTVCIVVCSLSLVHCAVSFHDVLLSQDGLRKTTVDTISVAFSRVKLQ